MQRGCLVVEPPAHARNRLQKVETFLTGAQIMSPPAGIGRAVTDGMKTPGFSVTVKAEPRIRVTGPRYPQPTQDTAERGGIGFDEGMRPVNAILKAYTMAPFDECGRHGNPHVGDHCRAVTDRLFRTARKIDTGEGAEVGIWMDEYPIPEQRLPDGATPVGLDDCCGHADACGVYHGHANDAGPNAMLPGPGAQSGCGVTDPKEGCDASAPPRWRA
ncbi:hypothetical protein [uncultured Roseobacter sp.]|uniref:hypothetical protein n=1 Tax=uncultured Roseobacter sp. TaxID=114847 RepID=UPI002632D0AA|nr:hypothetical protein [uncultured Roseobacter sp.]